MNILKKLKCSFWVTQATKVLVVYFELDEDPSSFVPF